ncbi:hypothetical protein JCM11251_006638 [Rhodosporidiobolus azoricus]
MDPIDAFLPDAIPASRESPPPSSPPSLSFHFRRLPFISTPRRPDPVHHESRSPLRGFGSYPAHSANDDSDLVPNFSSRLTLEIEGRPGNWDTGTRRKTQKATRSFACLPGGRGKKKAKERLEEDWQAREEKRPREEKRQRAVGGAERSDSEMKMDEVYVPVQQQQCRAMLGAEERKGGNGSTVLGRTATERPYLSSSRRPHPSSALTRLDSTTRGSLDQVALPSFTRMSELYETSTLAKREKKWEMQFYRDQVEGSSGADEKAECEAQNRMLERLSDPETTGENVGRRRPPLISRPRFPLHIQPPSAPQDTQSKLQEPKKHFKLATSASAPVHGGPPAAGPTDVSFNLEEGFSFRSAVDILAEHGEGSGELFAAQAYDEPPFGFGEGPSSFVPVEDGGIETPPTATKPGSCHVAHESASSSAWMDDFPFHYGTQSDSLVGDESGEDASSDASSDVPLARRYPRRLPVLQTLSIGPSPPYLHPHPAPRIASSRFPFSTSATPFSDQPPST